MSDTISRQMAIDDINRALPDWSEDKEVAIDCLSNLPAVDAAPVVRGSWTERQVSFSCTHENDLISRQAAIELVGDLVKCILSDSATMSMKMSPDYLSENLYKPIRQMASAQPERKRGRWIIKENPETGWYRVTCSECGEDETSTAPCIGFYPNAKVTWDYCPNCGADMREDEDEVD